MKADIRAPRRLHDEFVTLKHGAGGRAMRALIEGTLAAGFMEKRGEGIDLSAMDDGAALPVNGRWMVITTDSHVIHPIFFPGGDIGRLAIAGTVNDLAVMGAAESPVLTSAVVIEEGFPQADLQRIQGSMQATCREAGATVVTGDTKVMGRGELDGIIINTTGVGLTDVVIRDAGLRPGDRIIVTGPIADHGIALMAARRGFGLDGDLCSDVAPINGLIRRALDAVPGAITAMKDPTRGGLASALSEMAEKSGVGIVIEEQAVPITPSVRSASEILGLDPFHIANEGKALLGVRADEAENVLCALRSHPQGANSAIIGACSEDHPGRLVLDTGFGRRLITEPEGEPLPRIC